MLHFLCVIRFQCLGLLKQQIPKSPAYIGYAMSAKTKTPDKDSTPCSSYFSPTQAEHELTFRIPMRVTSVRLFRSGDTYAVCPKCQIGLEREYMAFCDVCGQKLSWHQFNKAKVVRVPERSHLSD